MRWYQLDPQQWSSGSSGASGGSRNRGLNIPQVPSFKVYATRSTTVSPAAATFEALNRRAASSIPTYLTRPVFLPSTVDDDEDDNEEDEMRSSVVPTTATDQSQNPSQGNQNNSNHSNNRRGMITTEESDDDTINTVNSSACVSQISVQFEEHTLDGLD